MLGKQRSLVGIDAGGTTLRVQVAAGHNRDPLANREGVARPDGGPEAVGPTLSLALRDAGRRADEITSVCAGITKFTRGDLIERWKVALTRLMPNAEIVILPDYAIAFSGAVEGNLGLAVIAGTGSVVYGENEAGETVRVGGRGWEYGDEGSGAHLTEEALRRTLRALDGLDPRTPLINAVCQEIGTADPASLAETARRRADAEGRGFLMPLALAMAKQGDAEASNLFVGAAGWLAAYTRAAAERLGIVNMPGIPVATVGGLWEAGELITGPFSRVLVRRMPGAKVIPPRRPPVEGAVMRAYTLLIEKYG